MGRRSIPLACLAVLVGLIIGLLPSRVSGESPIPHEKLDLTAITLLFDIIDTIRVQAGDLEQLTARLRQMGEEQREDTLSVLVRRNRENPELTAQINALLKTPAYSLYFDQFRSADPARHRDMFYNLPYRALTTPGDIAGNFLVLFQHGGAVKEWIYSTVARLDPAKCCSLAARWLPEDTYHPPQVYFIYDGMGDAFVRDGNVCFDLFGAVLSHRPAGERYANLSTIDRDQLQQTLAHEFHHIFLRPMLRNWTDIFTYGWQKKWIASINKRLVMEGTAQLCNPPAGFKKMIMEDPQIVGYWINQLNSILAAVESGRITEAEADKWLDDSYQESAVRLLENYLIRDYEGDEFQSQLVRRKVDRPVFVYTASWWMIKTISRDGTDRQKVLDLIDHPDELFDMYNEIAREHSPSLLVGK